MIVDLMCDKDGYIVMLCDNEGKHMVEKTIKLLSQLAEQAETLGAMEMGGEISEAQWNLENLLDMATILQEGKLFTIMKNAEKFKEIFGFDLKGTCQCTSEKYHQHCKDNPNFNITNCPLWLNDEYKEIKE
jgi:hypothetical protein